MPFAQSVQAGPTTKDIKYQVVITFEARRFIQNRETIITRALYGNALENRRKWYGLGVPRFFKWCGIWYLSLRYLMVRLPTSRFFKLYVVTVSQHCGKQMARYMVTILFAVGKWHGIW